MRSDGTATVRGGEIVWLAKVKRSYASTGVRFDHAVDADPKTTAVLRK
jgi:hypothetical protein